MKSLLILAASAAVLTTAACAPTKPVVRTALDCPAKQGELTLTGKAVDGKSCNYRSSEGIEIALQLVSVTGNPAATLQKIEDQISPAAQRTPIDSAKDAAEAAKDTAEDAKDAADDAKEAAKDAEDAAREAAEDAGHSVSIGAKDDWDTGKPSKAAIEIHGKSDGHKGVTVDGDDDNVHVDLPGIHINARDNDANVSVAGIRINASDDKQTIHILRDVRLRGESLSRTKRGVRATFISATKPDAEGYRFVGYEAAGPKVGPLTVAVVKAKTEVDTDDDVARDIKRLVRRNGGV